MSFFKTIGKKIEDWFGARIFNRGIKRGTFFCILLGAFIIGLVVGQL